MRSKATLHDNLRSTALSNMHRARPSRRVEILEAGSGEHDHWASPTIWRTSIDPEGWWRTTQILVLPIVTNAVSSLGFSYGVPTPDVGRMTALDALAYGTRFGEGSEF